MVVGSCVSAVFFGLLSASPVIVRLHDDQIEARCDGILAVSACCATVRLHNCGIPLRRSQVSSVSALRATYLSHRGKQHTDMDSQHCGHGTIITITVLRFAMTCARTHLLSTFPGTACVTPEPIVYCRRHERSYTVIRPAPAIEWA